MPARRKISPEKTFLRNMRRLQAAGLKGGLYKRMSINDIDIQNLNGRIDKVLELLKGLHTKKLNTMLCFIMYDIEDNKIRNHIAKYLLRKGCIRVQKSVFLGKVSGVVYRDMSKTLSEVNSMYDNNDSIFFLPVGEDNINSMKVIGQNVDFDVIKEDPNTYFF